MARFQRLASELRTFTDRADELAPVIEHVLDETFEEARLYEELVEHKLGFFAAKLAMGHYHQADIDDAQKALDESKAEPAPETPVVEPTPEPAPEQPVEQPSTEPQPEPSQPAEPEQAPAEQPTEAPAEQPAETPAPEQPSVDISTLPRCPVCEEVQKSGATSAPEGAVHTFNTYDHPYDDPNKPAQAEGQQ